MMFQPSLLTPDTLVQGRYRIVRVVGQGGMGVVYEAKDERLNNTVALKQMIVSGQQLDQAFEREARLLAGLRHGSLPKVMDYFINDQGQFLVMEFIGGQDLAALMELQQSLFPVQTVLRWAYQLLEALEYLHNQRPPIIHRDIKPQNLKLTDRNEVILLDFGLAKNSDQTFSQATANRSVYGYTPQYSPPEQIHGAGTDARSDIYALGATIYFLLVGTAPASALTRTVAFTNDAPDPLRPPHELRHDLPLGISRVVMKAMAIKAAQRYPTATAMLDALHAADSYAPRPELAMLPTLVVGHESDIRTIGRAAPTVTSPLPGVSTSARRPLLVPFIAGALVLILAVVGVGALMARSVGTPPPTAIAVIGAAATTGVSVTPSEPPPTTQDKIDAPTPSPPPPVSPTTLPTALPIPTVPLVAIATIDSEATAIAFRDGQRSIASESNERVAKQSELPIAAAQYDPGTEALLLREGYSDNIIGPKGQRGLRTNGISRDGSLWVRDLDYTIDGYGYALADMAVFREMLTQFLTKVDRDGEVPETVLAGSQDEVNSGAWDSMPNLIHAVYVYVAKTGDREFYRSHRDALLQVGGWIDRLDTNGDGLPEHNSFIYGYYNSVDNSVRHTYALAKFYAAYHELAELEASIGNDGAAWSGRAETLRAAFHAEGSPYWTTNPWPIAWLRPDDTPIETLETFGVFEALRVGLIGPADGERYNRLVAALQEQLPNLAGNGAPMRLALGGYPEDVLRSKPKVPIWMLDVSASWIVGTAAPAYAVAGAPETARRLVQEYTARVQAGRVYQFVASDTAQFGPGRSAEYDLPWDSAAWFMAVYGGHYGLTFTPAALVIAPHPFMQPSGDGIASLSYQGALLNLSLDAAQRTYRISVDRPTAVVLRPMFGGDSMRLDDGPPQPEATVILQPNHTYVVVTQ